MMEPLESLYRDKVQINGYSREVVSCWGELGELGK